jgi:hypothetical protein
MAKIPFVGKRYAIQAFRSYLPTVRFGAFQPRYVVLHHTASPSLAMRPQGFTDQHLRNLLHYYGVTMGWSGAPHLFVDDREDGIIVFQRLDRRGVHARSFNNDSWGVEMLGDYDREQFHVGRGRKVRDATMQALAAMCERLGVSADTIRFHRDDPKTAKSCPGRHVDKADVVRRVAGIMGGAPPADLGDTEAWATWTVRLPGGAAFEPVHVRGGRPIAPVRRILDELAPGGSYRLAQSGAAVEWTPPGRAAVRITVAEIDEAGAAWALVRDLAEAAGRTVQVAGREVRIL